MKILTFWHTFSSWAPYKTIFHILAGVKGSETGPEIVLNSKKFLWQHVIKLHKIGDKIQDFALMYTGIKIDMTIDISKRNGSKLYFQTIVLFTQIPSKDKKRYKTLLNIFILSRSKIFKRYWPCIWLH